jgi:hypothetical protein
MNIRKLFDPGIVFSILLSMLSLFGICVVLGVWLYNNERIPVQASETETPFQYVYLGTEPSVLTLTPEMTDTPIFTPTSAPSPLVISSPTKLVSPVSTLARTAISPATATLARTATPSATATSSSILSQFDDTYFELLYDGDWTTLSDVTGAYQDTLHISYTVGNSVLFTFVGEKVDIVYQTGPSLGQISINLDGFVAEVSEASNQTQFQKWESAPLVRVTHELLIEHLSGGSVNLDSIIIPNVSTQTPNP